MSQPAPPTCTLQGEIVNPDGSGFNGVLTISYIVSGSVEYTAAGAVSTSGAYFARVAPTKMLRIPVNNGIVLPTSVVPNSYTSNSTSVKAVLCDFNGNVQFDEVWIIAPNASGIFDVGSVIPIASNQLSSVVGLSLGQAPTIVAVPGVQGPQGVQGFPGTNGLNGTNGTNAQIGNLSGNFVVQPFIADGKTTTFQAPIAGAYMVFDGGGLLSGLTNPPDYTVNGQAITLNFTPVQGSVITIIVFPTTSTGSGSTSPTFNSITLIDQVTGNPVTVTVQNGTITTST